MERHAFAMKIKEGQMNTYRKCLGEIWPELTAFLDRNEIKNFSIWNAADLIFGYYENVDGKKLSEEELAAGRVHLEWNAGNRTDLPVGQYAFVFTNVGSYRSHSESVQAFTAEQYVAYLKGEEIPDETENGTDDVITLNKTEYEDYQKWLEEYRNNMQEDIPEEINETLPTVTEAETATSYTEEETEGESNVESIR